MHLLYFLSIVGLMVGGFVYRKIGVIVSVVSGRLGFGACIRCRGMAMAKEQREAAYCEECEQTPF